MGVDSADAEHGACSGVPPLWRPMDTKGAPREMLADGVYRMSPADRNAELRLVDEQTELQKVLEEALEIRDRYVESLKVAGQHAREIFWEDVRVPRGARTPRRRRGCRRAWSSRRGRPSRRCGRCAGRWTSCSADRLPSAVAWRGWGCGCHAIGRTPVIER